MSDMRSRGDLWAAAMMQLAANRPAEPSRVQSYNPKPRGIPREGSATEAVLVFMRGSGRVTHTFQQLQAATGRTHKALCWALIYLRELGYIESTSDASRNSRYLRYSLSRQPPYVHVVGKPQSDERVTLGAATPIESIPPRAGDARNLGDVHAGVVTANAPRTCGTCARLSAVGICISAAESGVRSPGVNIPRRCPAYVPMWGAADKRNGRQLWPELA